MLEVVGWGGGGVGSCGDVEIFLWARHVVCFFLGQISLYKKRVQKKWREARQSNVTYFYGLGLGLFAYHSLAPSTCLCRQMATHLRSQTILAYALLLIIFLSLSLSWSPQLAMGYLFLLFSAGTQVQCSGCSPLASTRNHPLSMRCSRERVLAAWSHCWQWARAGWSTFVFRNAASGSENECTSDFIWDFPLPWMHSLITIYPHYTIYIQRIDSLCRSLTFSNLLSRSGGVAGGDGSRVSISILSLFLVFFLVHFQPHYILSCLLFSICVCYALWLITWLNPSLVVLVLVLYFVFIYLFFHFS